MSPVSVPEVGSPPECIIAPRADCGFVHEQEALAAYFKTLAQRYDRSRRRWCARWQESERRAALASFFPGQEWKKTFKSLMRERLEEMAKRIDSLEAGLRSASSVLRSEGYEAEADRIDALLKVHES